MFFSRKKEDPELEAKLEAEYHEAVAEMNCHMELESIMKTNSLEWRDVLNIVKERLN